MTRLGRYREQAVLGDQSLDCAIGWCVFLWKGSETTAFFMTPGRGNLEETIVATAIELYSPPAGTVDCPKSLFERKHSVKEL